MIVLGIAFLSDASAAVIRDGEVVAAVSEERLNRKKLWNGVPLLAIDAVLEQAGISLGDVDFIATHGACPQTPDRAPYDAKRAAIARSDLSAEEKSRQLDALDARWQRECSVMSERTPAYLQQIRALGRPVKVYGHHQAHAATAFFGSGWENCLVLTADGWGEDGSSTLWEGRGTQMAPVSATPSIDSLGYFYGGITKALGFIPHRHEGKVLGLAAYCTAPKSITRISEMVEADTAALQFRSRMDRGLYMPFFENPALASYVSEFSREDVSAAAQQTLERVVTSLVSSLGERARRLALSGGLFANVKLNQRLTNLDNVGEVYVFPNMGDGGLSIGAAWLAWAELMGTRPATLPTLYLGTDIDEAAAANALEGTGLQFSKPENTHARIAELLANDHVVARATGRMEFGPRALGHRSILFKAGDPSVNVWLNERLHRSEFMPFAPATLKDAADDCYVGLERAPISSRFMTATFDCTPAMLAKSAAAVHVDGTARPQVVEPDIHPDFHDILTEYRARTGLPTLINTSFNMHEEPIVATAHDAVRAFLASGLRYLALGPFIVMREDAVL